MHRAILAVPVLAFGLVAGCSGSTAPSGSPTSPPPATQSKPSAPPTASVPQTVPQDDGQRHVTYQVTGTAHSVSVTYTTGGTDTAQESGRSLPFEKTVSIDSAYGFVYISAQNMGASGSVTCTILVDGKVLKTTTSAGGYQICQVNDTL